MAGVYSKSSRPRRIYLSLVGGTYLGTYPPRYFLRTRSYSGSHSTAYLSISHASILGPLGLHTLYFESFFRLNSRLRRPLSFHALPGYRRPPPAPSARGPGFPLYIAALALSQIASLLVCMQH